MCIGPDSATVLTRRARSDQHPQLYGFSELWHAPGALSREQVQEILTRTTADIDAALQDPNATGIGR
ncbi:hypothetical protein [Dactylosporangium sp. NPDC048998]|uniref:hypothetical protein n=1 Tax=Dactylosporangium sp. NPDC048998 TaxID=3363976 RepID=UPI0037239908